MKLVVQRVSKASVSVNGQLISRIEKGYLVLVGIGSADTNKEVNILAEKLSKLRIMKNVEDKMSLSVGDVKGEMLIVSQFTLLSNTTGGNRPSFLDAANRAVAEPLYKDFVAKLVEYGISVKVGKFGADMNIDASLDGPVTIIIEK